MEFQLSWMFILYLCFGLSVAAEQKTYKAAVVGDMEYNSDFVEHLSIVQEASDAMVDVLVLPLPKESSMWTVNNYDEIVRAVSDASKTGRLYIVAHFLEKTTCTDGDEVIRSNLVFDREGTVVSVYRKPFNNIANCTTTVSDIGTFTTDFGVTFGVLMEEDLLLLKSEDLKGFDNFVVTGNWNTEIPFVSASQFASSWASVNRAVVISTLGIITGKDGVKTEGSNLEVAEININQIPYQDLALVPPVSVASSVPSDEWSMYAVSPLPPAAAHGFHHTLCHGNICCHFYVKTNGAVEDDDVSYGLAVFEGRRGFSSRDIGVNMCGLFACAGLDNTSCSKRINNTNMIFEKISISGNFTVDNTEYPIILTSANSNIASNQFHFEYKYYKNHKQVTVHIENVKNLLNFGIFGRDYTKDVVKSQVYTDITLNTPGYIIGGDLDEFFDYVWIRLRILIFLVSIYVLEML